MVYATHTCSQRDPPPAVLIDVDEDGSEKESIVFSGNREKSKASDGQGATRKQAKKAKESAERGSVECRRRAEEARVGEMSWK